MIPSIDTASCIRCGQCIGDCVAGAIAGDTMAIDPQRCIGCGHCYAICPVEAVGIDAAVAPVSEPGPHLTRDFEYLVRGMRSIRQYRDKVVGNEDLARLLDLVRYAPTGTNAQSVAITVLNKRERVKAVADQAMGFFRPLARVALSGVFMPLIRLMFGAPLATKLRAYREEIEAYFSGSDVLTHDAPCLVIFHAPVRGAMGETDAVIWAQTMALHARTLGLGVCWNGFLVRAMALLPALRRQCAVPRSSKVWACFTLGYPAVRYARGLARNPVTATILD